MDHGQPQASPTRAPSIASGSGPCSPLTHPRSPAAAALLAEFRKNKRVRWAETTADVREYRADAEEEDLKLQMWEQIKRKTKEAKLAVREARLATASRCGMHLALDLANAAPFCDFAPHAMPFCPVQ